METLKTRNRQILATDSAAQSYAVQPIQKLQIAWKSKLWVMHSSSIAALNKLHKLLLLLVESPRSYSLDQQHAPMSC